MRTAFAITENLTHLTEPTYFHKNLRKTHFMDTSVKTGGLGQVGQATEPYVRCVAPHPQQIALKSTSRGAARLALFAILLEADEAGCCTASTERLAALAGCRRNHFSRAVQGLLAAGEVAIEPGRGPNRRNVYRVLCARSLDDEQSHDGAHEPNEPPPAQPPAEDPLDVVYKLRAEAWTAFDMNGRTWHYSSEEERSAFARSEHSQTFLAATQELAAAAGVTVAPDGRVAPNN